MSKRRSAFPIIYTKGSHYDLGYDVGRTFRSTIQEILVKHTALNSTYLPFYESAEGKKKCAETLKTVQHEFPQYVKELEGLADGAQVPFLKLFLLNMDDIIPNNKPRNAALEEGAGCSSLFCTEVGKEALGHNEDGLSLHLNNCFILDAHIICEEPQGRWKKKEEKFTTFCYLGHLPGYTMGYNQHGIVMSCNTIGTVTTNSGKIPINFIGRALLTASNLLELQEILQHLGYGLASGVNVNIALFNDEGNAIQFSYVEAGPPLKEDPSCSSLQIHYGRSGEHLYHCNTYRILNSPDQITCEVTLANTRKRQKIIESFQPPKSKDDIVSILKDQKEVFRDGGPDERVKTMATGIFDLVEKTWSIFVDPSDSNPTLTLPIKFKCRKENNTVIKIILEVLGKANRPDMIKGTFV